MPDTEDKPSSDPTTPSSELGAAESLGAGSKTPADVVTCPTCGRAVEAGFRFCDGCGTKLGDVAQPTAAVPPKPAPTPIPKPEAKRVVTDDLSDTAVIPMLDRWRRWRAARSPLGRAESALEQPPRLEDTTSAVEPPRPPVRAEDAPTKPPKAEELRGARPAIAGRLRWRAPDTVQQESASAEPTVEAPPVWRPLPEPSVVEERSLRHEIPRFLLHFAIAFLSGGIFLFALSALIAVASDGRVALLDMRGLPIFIGGVVSIVVFSLLRTNERSRPALGLSRRVVVVSVVGGLAALVALAAVLYQPAVASRIQPRIERALQVFSSEDEDAVDGVRGDITEWQRAAEDYHSSLEEEVRSGGNPDTFRAAAAQAETNLEGITAQMRTHAEGARHPELRDALDDLVSIYDDQLGGLKQVNAGLLVENFELVRTGDARFKSAHDRAGALFQSRLQSLLERGGFDAGAFGRALSG